MTKFTKTAGGLVWDVVDAVGEGGLPSQRCVRVVQALTDGDPTMYPRHQCCEPLRGREPEAAALHLVKMLGLSGKVTPL